MSNHRELRVLHVVVGHGLPELFENTLRSFRAVLPDAPLLVIDNASPQQDLRSRLRRLAEEDALMWFVGREVNEILNGKTGGLYAAYRIAVEHAITHGYKYLHILQADMQLLWWDDDGLRRCEEIFRAHPTCLNICTMALSSDRGLADQLRVDPSTGYTCLTRYGLMDTGLYHLGRWQAWGAAFLETEEQHGSKALRDGWTVVVSPSPTEVQVPWPAVIRHGRQRGREVKPDHEFLCRPLSSERVDEVKSSTVPVPLEELAIPWGWSCLTPMWNSGLDQLHYLALRRKALRTRGWRHGLPRWETRGLATPLEIVTKPHRPSLMAVLVVPLVTELRRRWSSRREGSHRARVRSATTGR